MSLPVTSATAAGSLALRRARRVPYAGTLDCGKAQAEHVENTGQAVEPARRLTVLHLMDDASADSGGERQLVLTKPLFPARLADAPSDLHGFGRYVLGGMHDPAY